MSFAPAGRAAVFTGLTLSTLLCVAVLVSTPAQGATHRATWTPDPAVVFVGTHGEADSVGAVSSGAIIASTSADQGGTPDVVPGAPIITSLTAATASMTVRWQAPQIGGIRISGYLLRYLSDSGASWTVMLTNPYRCVETVTGLEPRPYVVEVAGINTSGTGPWSAAAGPVDPRADTSMPSAPGVPVVTGVVAGVASIQLSWNPPLLDGGSPLTSYAIRYSIYGGTSWTTVMTGATAGPFTLGTLSPLSSYVVEVAAANAVGIGVWSSPSPAVRPFSASNGIEYHGGPVLANGVDVYEIWYGDWTASSTPARQALVDTFLHGIGGTSYFNVNSSYYDGAGDHVQNVVTVAGSVEMSGSMSLSSDGIAPIVSTAISTGLLPVDANGVYIVFTSSNVSVDGFLTQYCGFHGGLTVNSTAVQYAFVGDPSGPLLHHCAAQTVASPNADPAGDGMVSIVAHELSEAVTDPQLNAWSQDSTGKEASDLCAWNFGSTFSVANGSAANVTWSVDGRTYQFLVQELWVNASGGYCALSY